MDIDQNHPEQGGEISTGTSYNPSLIKPTVTSSKLFIWAIILLLAFAGLAFMASQADYFPLDLSITRAVQSAKIPVLEQFLMILTWLGFGPQSYIITTVIFLIIILLGYHWEGAVGAISSILTTRIGKLVKVMIGRPRPSMELVKVSENLKDLSFPSGHVLYFVTFFGFLLFLTVVLMRPSLLKKALIVLFSLMIAFVSVSRVYYGHHWASDTLGGYLLGGALLLITIIIYQKGKAKFGAKKKSAAG